jgi:hypothetical protein
MRSLHIPGSVRLRYGVRQRASMTPEEDAAGLKMKKDGYSWEEIHAALPHRTKGTIQVRYSAKFKT